MGNELTPKQIVTELDRYIVGQDEAKKAVAVALRNRYRRSLLDKSLMEEITPKNIIMKGPTGVGKTEIARRLAKLVKAPFIKVEATKFTEVGYVGRDVESMIRDLVEVSIRLVKEERFEQVKEKAVVTAESRLMTALMKYKKSKNADAEVKEEDVLEELRAGKFDKLQIEIDVDDEPKPIELVPGSGNSVDLGSVFGGMMPKKKKRRKVSVKEAMKIITDEESNKLIDFDSVNEEAIKRAENQGIIFLDEIDKIATKGESKGQDVSREGVQRDILPIVEGCTVMTKYGAIRTDFILFIAAGAFHISSLTDLIPELQGRFPIVVTLDSLSKEDFIKILTEPENAITYQYASLLSVDNINLKFTKEAIEKMAEIAVDVNNTSENIGARRLYTIMEKLLEEVSFEAPENDKKLDFVVDANYVQKIIGKDLKNNNLSKYII